MAEDNLDSALAGRLVSCTGQINTVSPGLSAHSVVARRRHRVDYASSSRLAEHADAGAIQYRFGCFRPLGLLAVVIPMAMLVVVPVLVVFVEHELVRAQALTFLEIGEEPRIREVE